MDLSEAIRIRINNLITEKDITIYKLSILAGISRTTLSKFLGGETKYLRIDIIEYICEALQMKLKDFFDDPVFDNIDIVEKQEKQ